MKFKPWHFGLIAVALVILYFIVSSSREHLTLTSSGCPASNLGITPLKKTSDGIKVRLYTQGECNALKGRFADDGKTTWGMANNLVGECSSQDGMINYSFCNQDKPPSTAALNAVKPPVAKPKPHACPPGHMGVTSVKTSGGQKVRLYTQGECNTLKGHFTGDGKTTWGMANNLVGECLGTPGGHNVGFCNREKPASVAATTALKPAVAKHAPAKASAARPAARPVPQPVAYGSSGPGATLTCNTFPVYGAMGTPYGSGNMSNHPPVWNVVQPPSGWNSKTGFTMS